MDGPHARAPGAFERALELLPRIKELECVLEEPCSPDATLFELSESSERGGVLDALIRCHRKTADLAALLRQQPATVHASAREATRSAEMRSRALRCAGERRSTRRRSLTGGQ